MALDAAYHRLTMDRGSSGAPVCDPDTTTIGDLLPLLANPSLASIAALLGTPAGATLAWVHMLAFDVFIGRWIYLDSRENRVSPWLMAPMLTCVLLVGPLGFLLYLAVRALTPKPHIQLA